MPGYDWDPAKAAANLRKHGVSFDEADSALDDPLAWTEPDESLDEARLLTICLSKLGRLLVVVTSNGGDRPRLISARRATKRERDAYERRRRA